MKKDQVVVTGGAGFIGSNLAETLAEDHDVVILDDLSSGFMKNIPPSTELIKGSITDLGLLKEIFLGAKYVFHLAAVASVQRSIEDPIATNMINTDGILNVLVAARDCGVDKVIFASSSSVYGDAPILPKKEDMMPDPRSPYAVSKLLGEYYCHVFSDIYGLKTTSLRYFNVFGPKQNPTSEYSAVIPRFISRILQGKPPVIYGDGSQTRDFVFVKDVVKANILAMESDVVGVFNIASQRSVSLNELAHTLTEITGNEMDPVYENSKPGDIKDSLADISLARTALGYRPYVDLITGLKETVEWYKRC